MKANIELDEDFDLTQANLYHEAIAAAYYKFKHKYSGSDFSLVVSPALDRILKRDLPVRLLAKGGKFEYMGVNVVVNRYIEGGFFVIDSILNGTEFDDMSVSSAMAL